ncbi:MAG: dicarboxylate/amino acid:cation symporter [Gammaproteobacteria bacterium]|nr:dicarboxylate/amino acid:cation symporter [Gammaproteobacteria bacterium]
MFIVISMTLTSKILIGMIAGFILGILLNSLNLSHTNPINIYLVDGILDTGGQIFLSLLRLMVVPLVFFSLVSGVASLENNMNLSVIASKTLGLYLVTTAIAISLGLVIAILLEPGIGLNLITDSNFISPEKPQLKDVIINIFPTNPVKAMAEGNMLQIIVFSIFFGAALRSIGNENNPIKDLVNKITDIILKMVFLIIEIAPYGVFCLMGALFVKQGIYILGDLSYYFFIVLGVLFIHGLFTYSSLLLIFTKINPLTFYNRIKPIIFFAFSTSSSNATMPVTLKTVIENLGVNRKIASFTVPLGATINMDGTAIMQGVATVFIANAYSVDLFFIDYLMVIVTATLASIGTAGVPGVGLIMLAMVLAQVGLPTEGIALIIGVDRLLDMVRTVVNVTGDSAVSTIIASSENQLESKN